MYFCIEKLFKIYSIILLWLFSALFPPAPRYIEHRYAPRRMRKNHLKTVHNIYHQ